ncbi:MAG TPA: carboxypeptidase regulatory-like domain-containing protein [Pyrinomonadaceae bacterium]|nr:carboxypeptidase regulatory-like domain-containing protein [Pyrinomonadaceae bacterium]
MRRFLKQILFAFPILAILCVATAPSAAQDLDTVTISGRVMDQNGAIIPGASVTATLIKTNVERTVVANDEGRYRIIQLEPGVYSVKASFTNFAAEEKTELTTIAGQNVQLDFALKPADVTAETVVVTANPPEVDTSRTVVGGTVETREVDALPVVSRSPLDLIFTLGGVSDEALSVRDLAEDRTSSRSTPEEAGIFSLSGGPAYSNNITIDGMDNNDDRAARERMNPSLDAIEEVQVIRNQFAAEYGRASGGRVNLRTRGGSNKFHGRAYYFFRNDFFNANTFNNKRLGLSRLPFEEHDPGFTFSGPVVIPRIYNGRSRTHFFTSYEYDTILDSTTINTLVPIDKNPLFPLPAPTNLSEKRNENPSAPALVAPNGIAPFVEAISTPQKTHTFTTRVDHKFTDMHNGQILWQLGRFNNLRQFGGGSRLAESLQGRTRNTDSIAYLDNYVISGKAVAQTRFQWSRLTPAITATGGATSPVVLIDIHDERSLITGTLVAGSSTTGATDRRETRFQGQEIFAYITGQHSLKFGGDIQQIKSTFIDLSDATGTFDFDSFGDFLQNRISRFRQNFQTTSTQKNTYIGIYAQDDWRLKPNLLLSYGLRWETETILPDRNNFGPRVALAYDPFKSGKTVIRAGAGMFYNRALLRTIDDFTLGAQQLFLDTNDIPVANRATVLSQIRFPTPLTADSAIVRQFGTLNTGFSRRLDPTLRIPESYQANFGIERELPHSWVVEANYTYNRGIHLWREFNVNAPRLPAGFSNFTQYLLSGDFTNFLSAPGGSRPIYNVSNAGDLVRFALTPFNTADPNRCFNITLPDVVGCTRESGVNVSVINLNSFTSGTAVDVALAALNALRPDPTRTEIEQLISVGNSFYHGATFEIRNRWRQKKSGAGYSFRAVYTLSFLTDDGIVNTSDALVPGDFRRERSRSLLDRRHRFAFSGTFDTPWKLGHLRFAPIVRLASGAPFNLSIGGADRNLDDVGNDRPNFSGDLSQLRWRKQGDSFDASILNQFSLPPIGQSGNLPRNAGTGPGQFIFDLNVSREFKVGEKMRLRLGVEFDNVLNATVFSFGSEFIDFNAFGPSATPAQRQAFLDNFLVTQRTLRQRQVRFGIRFDF